MAATSGFKMYTIELIQRFIIIECGGIMFDKYSTRNSHKEISKKQILKFSDTVFKRFRGLFTCPFTTTGYRFKNS